MRERKIYNLNEYRRIYDFPRMFEVQLGYSAAVEKILQF